MDGVRSKCRSLGQILEKSCLHFSGHMVGQIFLKLATNVCLDDILIMFDHGWGLVKMEVTRSNVRKQLFTL